MKSTSEQNQKMAGTPSYLIPSCLLVAACCILLVGCEPETTVLSVDGQPVALVSQRPDVARALIFVRTDCPIGNRYVSEIRQMATEFEARGVRFALVYPTPSESQSDVDRHMTKYSLNLPAYRDPFRDLSKQLGATITPEAVVFDSENRMVYRGRIDDRFVDFGQARPAPTTRDLRDVLERLVADEKVDFATTNAIGCYIEPLPDQ